MILKGSIIACYDNSGGKTIKVIQLYSTLSNRAGEGFRSVLCVFNPNKNKLQNKKHYTAGCIGVQQITHRGCDNTISFCKNAVIMLSDNCKKLLGTRIYGAIQKECEKLNKYEHAMFQKIVLLSRFVI